MFPFKDMKAATLTYIYKWLYCLLKIKHNFFKEGLKKKEETVTFTALGGGGRGVGGGGGGSHSLGDFFVAQKSLYMPYGSPKTDFVFTPNFRNAIK